MRAGQPCPPECRTVGQPPLPIYFGWDGRKSFLPATCKSVRPSVTKLAHPSREKGRSQNSRPSRSQNSLPHPKKRSVTKLATPSQKNARSHNLAPPPREKGRSQNSQPIPRKRSVTKLATPRAGRAEARAAAARGLHDRQGARRACSLSRVMALQRHNSEIGSPVGMHVLAFASCEVATSQLGDRISHRHACARFREL